MQDSASFQPLRRAHGRIHRGLVKLRPPVALPSYHSEVPSVHLTDYRATAEIDHTWDENYPALIGACQIGEMATSSGCLGEVMRVLDALEPDSYTRYLQAYYAAGRSRYGDLWRYADITTLLYAVSALIRPQRYLEIGVRRGRSSAMVAAASPTVDVVGFDMWVEDYGGMVNPGGDFVLSELKKVGFAGRTEFVSGDSHVTVPDYFQKHPDSYFDLITVDGDHSERGASMDLRVVLPRLKIGGVIVFDDIASPGAGFLRDVWRRYVGDQGRFVSWEFDELGFGVACAVRRY